MKKRLIIVGILLFISMMIFFVGMVSGMLYVKDQVLTSLPNIEAPPIPVYPTGYDVLKELNKYRESNSLSDFVLYPPLCNNIAARWANYRKTNSHDNLDQFVNQYMGGMYVAEILVSGTSAAEMVHKWSVSPSHDTYIKNNSKICVYSDDGSAVALLTK